MSKHATQIFECGCQVGYITSVTPPDPATADGGAYAEPCLEHSRKLRFKKDDYDRRLAEMKRYYERKVKGLEFEIDLLTKLARGTNG